MHLSRSDGGEVVRSECPDHRSGQLGFCSMPEAWRCHQGHDIYRKLQRLNRYDNTLSVVSARRGDHGRYGHTWILSMPGWGDSGLSGAWGNRYISLIGRTACAVRPIGRDVEFRSAPLNISSVRAIKRKVLSKNGRVVPLSTRSA